MDLAVVHSLIVLAVILVMLAGLAVLAFFVIRWMVRFTLAGRPDKPNDPDPDA